MVQLVTQSYGPTSLLSGESVSPGNTQLSVQIDLKGTTALVTGGAIGIGRGITDILVKAGATVIIADVNSDTGQDTASKLNVDFIETDVANENSIVAMASVVEKKYGTLHFLVNNAGIAIFNGIDKTTSNEWDRLLNINLKEVYGVTRACLSLLKNSAPSSVVNIGSVHSRLTVPTMTAYAAAKGGVMAMTRSLAQELAPLGIRVNTISPGFVDTPLFRRWLENEPDQDESLKRVHDIIPVGYLATTEEIGNLTAFLASPLVRSINGVDYIVDGGLTTRLMH